MKPIKIKTLLLFSGFIISGLIVTSFIIKQYVVKAVQWNDLSLSSVTINWLPEDLLNEGSNKGLGVLLMYEQEVTTYASLYEKSDLVAIVSATNRKQGTNTMLTEVKINEVLKGEEKDSISIFEPMVVVDKNTIRLNSIDLPLRENEQYLVFLNQSDNERYNFTSTLYGKYHIQSDRIYTIEFPLNNSTFLYEDLKSYDMLDFTNDGKKQESDFIYDNREKIFSEAKNTLLNQ